MKYSIHVLSMLFLVCQVGLARDRAEPIVPAPVPSVQIDRLPTEQIPFSYRQDGENIIVPTAVMTAFVRQQTEIKLAAAVEVSNAKSLVVEAREQIEANTAEIRLSNVQRELDVQKLQEVYAALEQMYLDWQVTKENLFQTEQNLAATRGELQTARQHLGAAQGQLQGAMGALGQANQMIDKMKSRAWIPAPISTVINLFDPI